MELHQRIKQRRMELDMSQEELAFKLGYKSRSSINKIEMGDNDIPQSRILAFAKALNTTPSYLLGLDVQPKEMNIDNSIIELIDLDTIKQMNKNSINRLNAYAQKLLALQQMEEEPVLMAAHHDNPSPEQQEKIMKDMDLLKRPES